MSPNASSRCKHAALCLTPSPHATEAGYQRPTKQQRMAASLPKRSNVKRGDFEPDPTTFPAPLVLPGDELALDPEYPPQSFQDWVDEEERNEVTRKKNVIYVVPQPEIDDNVAFMRTWHRPQKGDRNSPTTIPTPKDIVDYLAAFYHGMPVKLLPSSILRFVACENDKKKSSKAAAAAKYVGLGTAEECVRIRTRACPDRLFPRQINLDDLLDAAIGMLPEDAYALLFLVNYDLYEDEDDDFACGRAYGGSRVAVVSSARYNPDCDGVQFVERQHAWPASHCERYVSDCCHSVARKKKKPKRPNHAAAPPTPSTTVTPLDAAVSASAMLPDVDSSPALLSALWLGRVCRTASHELGHCFGIDHCVYYACIMQGTASLSEDVRQPPYSCPVDSAKILRATGTTASQRYRSLLAYCDRPERQDTHVFSAFAAWIRSRLMEMEKCLG